MKALKTDDLVRNEFGVKRIGFDAIGVPTSQVC